MESSIAVFLKRRQACELPPTEVCAGLDGPHVVACLEQNDGPAGAHWRAQAGTPSARLGARHRPPTQRLSLDLVAMLARRRH